MLELVTPATEMPVSVLDARQHCRASDADDAVLALYLAAATQAVQDETSRAMLAETWRLSLPAFPTCELVFPISPLIEVTEVGYWSADAVPVDTVLAGTGYQVIAPSGPTAQPGRLVLAAGGTWPSTQDDRADAVRVTFKAGYGTDPQSVPAPLRAAILLMTGSMYEFREADSVKALSSNPAVARLLAPYRMVWI